MPKGKKGNHLPLDPVDDFDQPVKQEPESEPATEQAELSLGEAAQPKPIRNGRMQAKFVRPHFEMDAKDERYVGFELSLPLTKEHEDQKKGHLPEEILQNWKTLRRGNIKRLEIESVEPQTITVGLMPEHDKDTDLTLVGALIERPTLALVEETGTGKVHKVVRLSFRAKVDLVAERATFAVQHFGKTVWFSTKQTQRTFLKKTREEEAEE